MVALLRVRLAAAALRVLGSSLSSLLFLLGQLASKLFIAAPQRIVCCRRQFEPPSLLGSQYTHLSSVPPQSLLDLASLPSGGLPDLKDGVSLFSMQ